MTPSAFRAAHPNLFFLDPARIGSLEAYLRRRGLLDDDEPIVAAEKAGEGNMNCTVRVRTPARTWIVKQARPWVEKYPQFEAPWDRALREAEFYRLVHDDPAIARFLPKLHHADPDARLLVLEDLGHGGDYAGVYRGETLEIGTLLDLADFLSALHAAFPDAARRPALPNREMRRLNHAHIFDIPLRSDNGLDLDAICPGLRDAARPVLDSTTFRDLAMRSGAEDYLADGPTLVHGDFFPGSLVRTPGGPRVIDPEFGHFGRPEWDVAVFLAHLHLGGQPAEAWHAFRNRYRPPTHFDECRVGRLAGIEITRRLIGYAQLPLACGIAARRAWLELAMDLVCRPETPLEPRDVRRD
ncbi:MAG: phosphotransferase [Verrucomicrobiales bacterium]|nr:phosphotransferase [Verrucomicrobiales bacterium]